MVTRRKFLSILPATIVACALPVTANVRNVRKYRYRVLTASEVSYLMDYPILRRDGDWDFEYEELPDRKMRMVAANSDWQRIDSVFSVGDIGSYHIARIEIENKIRVRD